MPEIVEIATIAASLKVFCNATILSAKFYKRYAATINQEYLPGLMIHSVDSYGKLLYFVLYSAAQSRYVYLAFNLGIEGKFVIKEKEANNTKAHFVLSRVKDLSSCGENVNLYFDESRPFGRIEIYIDPSLFVPRLVGYDMLKQGIKLVKNETTWNDDCWTNFQSNIKSKTLKNRMIYWHLLKQNQPPTPTSFLGLGNYLKSECLFLAKISPYRVLGSLSDAEIFTLYHSIIYIILAVYRVGGITIKSYQAPDFLKDGELGKIDKVKGSEPRGAKGDYKLKVYKQKTDPNGYTVISVKIKKGDQTTYWVPEVQK